MPRGLQRIQASLAKLAEDGADARQIAERATCIWQSVDSALSPVIGKMGVVALFNRSVYLTRTAHPWLSAVQVIALDGDDFAALETTLSQQSVSDAASAIDALLQNFYDLLTRLIGESLTQRLLRSVWEHPSTGDAAQDTTR